MFRSTVSTLTTTTLAGLMLALGACNKAADTASQEAAALAPAPAAVAAACDRQCLVNATDAYVAAIVSHNPSMAPLAANVVFVENVTKMQPGEGLWKTAVKAPSTFAIHVPDEINHTVGYLAMMTDMAPPPAPQGTSP